MNEELLEPVLRRLRVRRIIPWVPRDSVLCDIGCGFNAQSLQALSPHIRKGFGFDKKVQTRSSEKLSIQQHDLQDPLPLPDSSVDCVTMIAVLEHLSDTDQIFSEISRVTRPKGRLILTTPSPSSRRILEFLAFRVGIVSPAEIADHKHYWSLTEIEELLGKHGFHPVTLQLFSMGMNTIAVGEKS
jgi:SAM-dependent methyltransferase